MTTTPRSRLVFAVPSTVLAVVLTGVDARAQECDWETVASNPPPARFGHAMAYDAARGQLVVFGGTYSDDTWLWNGDLWRGPVSRVLLWPEPRASFAMTYDSARQRVVLFGGIRPNSCGGCDCLDEDPLNPYVRDTWEWNGFFWWPVSSGGPERGHGHAMAFDAARQRTVLYGGRECDGSVFMRDRVETWLWDGVDWDDVTSAGPGPREYPAMAYDSARQRVVLFGGTYDGDPNAVIDYVYPSDTWEWDGSSWAQVATAGPPGRERHAMAFDPARGRVVMFGGVSDPLTLPVRFRDTWEWDGVQWTQLSDSGPPERSSHAMAFHAERAKVALFGGATGPAHDAEALQDVWEWDGQSWLNVAAAPLPATDSFFSQSMAYDVPSGRTLLTNQAYTWGWDGAAWSIESNDGWRNLALASGPGGRPIGFGGFDETQHERLSRTVAWADGWDDLATTGPPARGHHRVAYDSQRGRLVLFGGEQGADTQLGDTWEWDGSAWTLASATGPVPRSRHGLAYDAEHGRVVLFGGWDGGAELSDTWVWDGSQWTQAGAGGPAGRVRHAMAYDSIRQRVVMTGGAAGSVTFSDTWEWDGSSWSQRDASGLAPILRHVLAYDSARERLVLFGGQPDSDEVGYGATRELASGLTRITQHLQDTTVVAGGDATLSLVAAGAAPLTYRWRRNGQLQIDGSTAEGTVISGASTATLTLTNVYPSVAGAWTCDVSDACGGISSSDPAELTVICTGLAPVFTVHPASAGLAAGATVVFSASAASPSPVTYRWQRNGLPLQDGFTDHGSTISGADTSTLTITQVNIADEGQYALAVSNPCGTAVSTAAVLGVCYPQWYQSGSGDRPWHTALGRAAFDRMRNRVVMLVDNSEVWPQEAETWEWDGTAWTLRGVNESVILGSKPVYHPDRQRVVARVPTNVFGSQVAMWEWNGAAWTEYGAPGPWLFDELAYDEARHHFVGFGEGGNTWTGDGDAWTLAASTGPGLRVDPVLTYDSNRQRVVLFGGISLVPPYPTLRDTWEWDGLAWSLRATTGPSGRSAPAMAYDPMRRTTVLFGGETTDPQTWEWDGNAWTVRLPTGPILNHNLELFGLFGSMIYDSTRARIAWFAGVFPEFDYAVPVAWELPSAAPPRILAGPQNTSAGAGATITLAVSAEGVAPLLYQWRKGGVALVDGPTPAGSIRSGVHSETLTILNSHATDSGVYDCVVSNACGSVASNGATVSLVFPRAPRVQDAAKVVGTP